VYGRLMRVDPSPIMTLVCTLRYGPITSAPPALYTHTHTHTHTGAHTQVADLVSRRAAKLYPEVEYALAEGATPSEPAITLEQRNGFKAKLPKQVTVCGGGALGLGGGGGFGPGGWAWKLVAHTHLQKCLGEPP
jgi:hypothetical protein